MGKLMKAECLKLSRLRSYRILLLCIVGMGLLTGYFFVRFAPFDLPAEYGTQGGYGIYMSMLGEIEVFALFSLIFAVLFIVPEFSNRTISISLLSGCSRWSVLLAKAIVFLAGLMPIVFLAPLMTALAVSIGTGSGNIDASMWIVLVKTTLLAALASASVGGLFFMIAILIRNIVGMIGAGIGVLIGIEIIGMFSVPTYSGETTLTYQMPSSLQLESPLMFVVATSAILVISLGISIASFQKAELK